MANGYPYDAGFKPITKCLLACVPMDGSFSDLYMPASGAEYESWVRSCQVPDFPEQTDFSYQRHEAVIRYPGNCDEIIASGANYVMWNNENFDGKVFYAFILKPEYKNPNVTWLHIKVDVFATYMDDIEIGDQFVDRMTVFSDNLYEHLEPESFSVNSDSYIVNEVDPQNADMNGFLTDLMTVVKVSIKNLSNEDSPEVYSQNGLPTPIGFFAVNTVDELKKFLNMVKWSYSSIIDTYFVPKLGVRQTVLDNAFDLNHGFGSSVTMNVQLTNTGNETFRMPNHAVGYTPVNKKLYSFPYTVLNFTNGTTLNKNFAFEGWNGTPKYKIWYPDEQGDSAKLVIIGYNDMTGNTPTQSYDIVNYPSGGITVQGSPLNQIAQTIANFNPFR